MMMVKGVSVLGLCHVCYCARIRDDDRVGLNCARGQLSWSHVGADGPYIVGLQVSRPRRPASLPVVAHAGASAARYATTVDPHSYVVDKKRAELNASHVLLLAVGIVCDDVPPALRDDPACGSCKICALPQPLLLGESANMWLDDDKSVSPSSSGVTCRQS